MKDRNGSMIADPHPHSVGLLTARESRPCDLSYRTEGFGRTFSLDGDSRGYPIVALSYQRVRNIHVGIIHVNQLDSNSGGAIWSRIDYRDG